MPHFELKQMRPKNSFKPQNAFGVEREVFMKGIAPRNFLGFAGLASLGGCAQHYSSGVVSDPYGFFSGIWHGFLFPYSLLANIISWLLSLIGIDFLSGVQIIGRPNTGVLFYYIGFVMGLSSYGGAAR